MEDAILKDGLAKLKAVARIRKEISAIYSRYHKYAKVVEGMSMGKIKHFDFRRAVDAIYYFGGGWPHPSSKGRMERLLDAFAGMYKVLHMIGEAKMVTDHLRKQGIEVRITKRGELPNPKISEDMAEWLVEKFNIEKPEYVAELVEQLVMICHDLQGRVCEKADVIRDELRPEVQDELGIDDPEYMRLEGLMKLRMGREKSRERVPNKIKSIDESVDHFKEAAQVIKKVSAESRVVVK